MTIGKCIITVILVMVLLNPVYPGNKPPGLDGGPTTSPAPSSTWTPRGTPSMQPGSNAVPPPAPQPTARPNPGAGSSSTMKPLPTAPSQPTTPPTASTPGASRKIDQASLQEYNARKQQIESYFGRQQSDLSKLKPGMSKDQYDGRVASIAQQKQRALDKVEADFRAQVNPGSQAPNKGAISPKTAGQTPSNPTAMSPGAPSGTPSPQNPSPGGKQPAPQETALIKQQIENYFKNERAQFSKQNPNLKPDQNLQDYYKWHDSLRAEALAKNLPSGLSYKETQDYYTRILDQQKQDRYNTWRTEVSRTSGPAQPQQPPAKVPGAGDIIKSIPDTGKWLWDTWWSKGWP